MSVSVNFDNRVFTYLKKNATLNIFLVEDVSLLNNNFCPSKCTKIKSDFPRPEGQNSVIFLPHLEYKVSWYGKNPQLLLVIYSLPYCVRVAHSWLRGHCCHTSQMCWMNKWLGEKELVHFFDTQGWYFVQFIGKI